MALRPLGHRVLIKPDPAPDVTASGLLLPDARDHVPCSGTVVAVGAGPARDQRIRQACLSRCVAIVEELADQFPNCTAFAAALSDELGRYRAQIERYAGSVEESSRVVFPAEAGLVLAEDDEEYVVINEDELVVVETPQESAA